MGASNNIVFLGATGVDTYHLFTKQPDRHLRRPQGPQDQRAGQHRPVAARLGRGGRGRLADRATTPTSRRGVSEGTISIATGILPNKIYEVAPYITTVNIGALYIGGMAMNKDSYDELPAEVQKIVNDVGQEYSKALGATLMQRYEGALKTMVDLGAKQTPAVRVTNMSAGEREKWVRLAAQPGRRLGQDQRQQGPDQGDREDLHGRAAQARREAGTRLGQRALT